METPKEDFKNALAVINKIYKDLYGETPEEFLNSRGWISASERLPNSDDQLVVVKTKTGAKYFGRTINGKFMDNVAAWLPLPE